MIEANFPRAQSPALGYANDDGSVYDEDVATKNIVEAK